MWRSSALLTLFVVFGAQGSIAQPVAHQRERIAVEPREILRAAAQPAQESDVVDADPFEHPQRETCVSTCRVEGLTRIETRTCTPYIADDARRSEAARAAAESVDTEAREGEARVLRRRPLTMASGAATVESSEQTCRLPQVVAQMVIAPTADRCWVTATKYCKYKPAGKTGYPCTCGNRAGYFG